MSIAIMAALVLTSLGSGHAGAKTAAESNKEANRLYQEERYKEAVALYQQGQSRDPEPPGLHIHLGTALTKRGRLGVAAVDQERGVVGRPARLRGKTSATRG